MINNTAIKQYKDVFGTEKMQKLWQEFKQDSQHSLQKLNVNNKEEVRLVFHSLRSSSKVFGLDAFSQLCEEIEDKIIKEGFSSELMRLVKKANQILLENIKEAEIFFSGDCNE